MPDRPSVTLYSQEGATFRHVSARIDSNGGLLVESNDVGAAPEALMGASSYEYWVEVPAAHKDALLLALIAEKFGGRERALEDFRDWCRERSLEHRWVVWPSFDWRRDD
jgi:hypothetical protein